jgi:hypothetical protein
MLLDRFPPVLIAAFGSVWCARGWLSVYFEQVVGADAPVQVVLDAGEDGVRGDVKLIAFDNVVIASGDAGAGAGRTALSRRDMRLCEPSGLRVFGDLFAGTVVADEARRAPAAAQLARVEAGEIDDALGCWSDPQEWGVVVACPSTVVSLLYGDGERSPVAAWALRTSERAATMFGAIETRFVDGPVFVDRSYRVSSRVVGVGRSPRSEYCWWDSRINEGDRVVATARVLTRVLTASL